jgi:hypothetical protein
MDPDPDPGGPQTYGSDGSGSVTLGLKQIKADLTWEAGYVTLERDGADGWAEVEEAGLADAEPVRQVASVGQRRRQPDQADLPVRVGRDEVGPGHDHLQHLHARTSRVSVLKQAGRVKFKGTESRDFLLFLRNLPPHLEPFLKVIFLLICYVSERRYAFHNSTEL